MASPRKIVCKVLETVLHKYPLINALTLLMLFAERASTESEPPIHPKIVYVNLLGFLACGILMSAKVKRKEAALVFCGQLIYFAYNFYNNNKLHYKEWLRLQMCVRQFGCVGVYVMFASIVDQKKSTHLRRIAEIVLGIYLFAYLYLINNTKEVRTGVISHVLLGDWGRYAFTVVLASCALSYFSGYFLRDMSLCAAVAIVFLTVLVDCHFSYWSRKGVHFWNQARMVGDNLCVCTGLFYAFFHIDNRVKMD
ncbi:transmembrane protein 101-like [Plakobranchus ocellatus]|uniref:Transmembrane protein 101-like n=1 Tax=Plakobranchus ocellatus TaxID=259542 RepID=A0AAV3ZJY0_9GAST|nr:transmembrane protein 101-like [Plakobranchus ocellatus]